MKTKTVVTLLIILALLAGSGVLILHFQDQDSPSGEMGAFLIEQLPANEIASITIDRPGDSVSMTKEGDLWVVKDRFGYPADFSKISDLAKTLKRVKVGRKFGPSDDLKKRLALKSPDDTGAPESERGTRVRLKDGAGNTLVDILLGKTRTRGGENRSPDGQYVMLANDPDIFLVGTPFSSFEVGPSAWLEKELVKVTAEDVKKIVSFGPNQGEKRFILERPEKGKDFELLRPSTDKKTEKSALNRLAGALSSLRAEDISNPSAPPESVSPKLSPRLDYYLYNGMIYHVFPGKPCSETGPCYLRLRVDYQKGPATEKEVEEDAARAKRQDLRLSPWVFEIPRWQHKDFLTDIDQLPAKDEQKGTKGRN